MQHWQYVAGVQLIREDLFGFFILDELNTQHKVNTRAWPTIGRFSRVILHFVADVCSWGRVCLGVVIGVIAMLLGSYLFAAQRGGKP